jgi:hypothetical protein
MRNRTHPGRSARYRAGTRRNKRNHDVPTFLSDLPLYVPDFAEVRELTIDEMAAIAGARPLMRERLAESLRYTNPEITDEQIDSLMQAMNEAGEKLRAATRVES